MNYKLMYQKTTDAVRYWNNLMDELTIPYNELARAFMPYAYDSALYECVRKRLAPNVCTHSTDNELNSLAHTSGDLRVLASWQSVKADYFKAGCDYVVSSSVPVNCFDATLLFGYKLASKGVLLGGQANALQSDVAQKLPPPHHVIEIVSDVLSAYPKGAYINPWLYVWLK